MPRLLCVLARFLGPGRTPTVRKTELFLMQQSLVNEGLVSRAKNVEKQTNLPLTFATILADPPWDVLQRGGRGAHRHYSLMTVAEITELPVGTLASSDAHLWLWVTNATLFAGQMVMTAWGFTYRSCLTWVKPGLGLGSSYLRNNTEHLLLGTKGKAPVFSRRGCLHPSKSIVTSRRSSTRLLNGVVLGRI